jgi:hypothetical protein
VLQDGEVESFMRLPIAEVADLVANTDEFKDNCNLVIIDFLIRHGHIVPEQPGYLALLAGMRQGDCILGGLYLLTKCCKRDVRPRRPDCAQHTPGKQHAGRGKTALCTAM